MRNLILSTLTAYKKINLVLLRIFSVPAQKMADEPELNIMESKTDLNIAKPKYDRLYYTQSNEY